MAERWLVTGGTGQVGQALRRLELPGVEIVAPSRAELDLAALPDLDLLFAGFSAVISSGAYTAVDKAESEPFLARAINSSGPARLAAAARRAGIPIVHVSTDYVFPADGQGPWREDAMVAPASAYGRTKAEGEGAVRSSGARHAIVRTAWVVSADGANFVKTMLRLGAEREVLRVVADQRGCPTHAGDLAEVLAAVTRRLVSDPDQASGIWHCTNSGETTWHGLAEHVFACAAAHGLKVPSRVEAITTAEYPTPARRPADSRLDCSKLERDFGITMRPWQDAVAEIVGELAQRDAQ
ncbi:dTDP-4-dehydrorhamnose reductase [Novosphingobium sp. TH158]|uniref:dTDP-4-dehydrorhamnose reductase n=1 Tax=Novosphingobium sp. TH158 TaxID=2067455 RepID=UPI000C7D2A0B|nr:dTDP-4-dehydrorhamnose reductase [Novosphingobium sp. TH158]PLK27167.1 dTDP-4-dehydrorhamnose reductase [Novosphingobium sp. TH158]